MEKKILFIDIETTGLSSEHHTITEIAILEAIPHQTKIEQKFHTKILITKNDFVKAQPKALEISGYSEKGWSNAMAPEIAAEKISQILCTCEFLWVGHNPYFDRKFIEKFLARNNQPFPSPIFHRFSDTRHLATTFLWAEHPAKIKSFSLDNLRKYLGWDVFKTHSALQDAKDCAKLWYFFTVGRFDV
tara:strand:+ start:281 stop:844 length:564 start_codon:yes stop_codon:yes gene_type:complete